MFERTKNIIVQIDEYVQYFGNFAIFISILFAGLYIALPSLQRIVELYVTNRASWYKFGTHDIQDNKWSKYISSNPNLKGEYKKNFYHIDVEPYLSGDDDQITLDEIRGLKDKIVVQNVNYPVMGRSLEGWFKSDKIKSNNEINSIAILGDCFYVWDIHIVDNLGNNILEKQNQISGNVWIKATKITCT